MADPIGADYINRYRARLVALHSPAAGVHVNVCAKRALRAAGAARGKRASTSMDEEALHVDDASDGGQCATRSLHEALNATFVLVPRGDQPYSYRLIEALAYGAVPVVLSDEYILPFSEVLEWEAFSVRWPYARLSSLVSYLRTLSAARVCNMRRQARAVYASSFRSPDAQVTTLLSILARRRAYINNGPI